MAYYIAFVHSKRKTRNPWNVVKFKANRQLDLALVQRAIIEETSIRLEKSVPAESLVVN